MDELKKTLTAVDRSTKASTKAFTKVVADVVKVTGELAGISEQVETLTTEIDFKQSALNAIEDDTKTATRLAKAELALRVTENEDKVLTDLLKKVGFAKVSNEELATLDKNLVVALSDTTFLEQLSRLKAFYMQPTTQNLLT